MVLSCVILFSGCKKETTYFPPDIEIILPENHTTFKLPAAVKIKVRVRSSNSLNYVRISIDNSELIPVLGQRFIYPSVSDTLIEYEQFIQNQPLGETGPYVFDVAVDDGKQVTRVFRDISFVNNPVHYKGFYLFTRPGINETQIDYYDRSNTGHPFATMNGELVSAAFSDYSDLLFVATTIPSRLFAFQYEDQELIWDETPEQPYPEYNYLLADENLLYIASENERISLLQQQSGYQKAGTGLLFDSIPEKIGVNSDFFIGDFRLRHSGQRAWVSFYKTTGHVHRRFSTFITVVDFYPFKDNSGFYVIGNRDGKGLFGIYNSEGNFLSGETPLETGDLSHTARIDYRFFLLTDERTLYRLDIVNKMAVVIKQFEQEIVDMAFDRENNRVFIADRDSVRIFSYPNMELQAALSSGAPVKAVKLRFFY